MEFGSADRNKDWAVVIHLETTPSSSYLLRPRGLDGSKKYRVTFDDTGKTVSLDGAAHARWSYNHTGCRPRFRAVAVPSRLTELDMIAIGSEKVKPTICQRFVHAFTKGQTLVIDVWSIHFVYAFLRSKHEINSLRSARTGEARSPL